MTAWNFRKMQLFNVNYKQNNSLHESRLATTQLTRKTKLQSSEDISWRQLM